MNRFALHVHTGVLFVLSSFLLNVFNWNKS